MTRWPWLVIMLWLALPVALWMTTPPLHESIKQHPVPLVPASAPSVITAAQMSGAFKESNSDNLLLAVLTNDKGFGPGDEEKYRAVVTALRDDKSDVLMVQDIFTTPQLREVLEAKDHKAWILPVVIAGSLDTPQGYDAYHRVGELIHRTVGDGDLNATLTGPSATVADLTDVGDADMGRIEIATAALVLVILLLVYRNVVTMAIPLASIGLCLWTARGLVSALTQVGLGISNETVILMTAMMAGAGTDYAVFLISRYHEELRGGRCSTDAVVASLTNVGKVVFASAATVAVTFLCMSFAKLGLLSTVGPALALTVGVGLLGAFSLLPALLTLAGKRGWVNPGRDLTTKFWSRSGERIVAKPARHLAVSVLVLGVLATFGCFVTFNWDESRTLPATTESNRGYAAIDDHFPAAVIPTYLVIHSPRDLRTPRSLADLEMVAAREAQLPHMMEVRGITRPLGHPLEQAQVSFQAGEVGSRLQEAAGQIDENRDNLTRLTSGANELAAALGSVRETVHAAAGEAGSALAVVTSPKLAEAQSLMTKVADSGMIDEVTQLAGTLPQTPQTREVTSTIRNLRGTFSTAMGQLNSLRNAVPSPAELANVQSGADQLATGSAQLADGVRRLVDSTGNLASGLHEASAFLLNLKHNAGDDPAMGGFYLPADALVNTDLRHAADIFVSPDGHTVRYLVQTAYNPSSNQAMDQVDLIEDVAHRAQPNTTLSDAHISTTGFPVLNRDLRGYYNQDMKFIMAVTLLVVFFILVLLLRAIVAPLHLIVSVVVSYMSALGLGVIVFQVLGHTPLSWTVPGMAFIVLVAVGADYNMLLISRVRDESPESVSIGVVKTVTATGGVITSAGLIFAASMFGLLFGSITGMVQAGFIIGVGLLVDTFVVRTITVPALAVLIGRANWWPTLWARPPVILPEFDGLLEVINDPDEDFTTEEVACYIRQRRAQLDREHSRTERDPHADQLQFEEAGWTLG